MKKAYRISLIFFACIGLSLACTKIETGYLSDYIKYRSPVLNVNTGVYSTTEALFTDGSTLPLEVELIEIRNSETGAVATDLLTEHEVNMWTAPYDYTTDTTEELVNEKLELRSVPAFEINAASGMVRFNPNTMFATGTNYEFDLRISNVRGTKEYENIGQVVMHPTDPIQYQGSSRFQIRSQGGAGTVFSHFLDMQEQIDGTNEVQSVTKISDASAPGVTVHLKFLDSNGVPFNPASGQVNEGWPGFNLPGYESGGSSVRTERTDTEFIYYFPVTPFPYFNWYNNNAWVFYYHIVPEAIGSIDPSPYKGTEFSDSFDPTHSHWANFRTQFKIYVPGTWEIVIKYPNITVAGS